VVLTDKTFKEVHHQLHDKASQRDLDQMGQNLLEKINELLIVLDGRYADKETTRKKLINHDKSVSNSGKRANFIIF
jgi:hypothetical protein